MKNSTRFMAMLAMLAVLVCNCGLGVMAETLTLPTALKVIEEEAFAGDDSLDKVVLPEGIREIKARSFADSSLEEINLPDSLEHIDNTAFDGLDSVKMTVNEGSYAFQWAVDNDYIASGASDALKDFTIENGVIIKYNGNGGDVIIPSTDMDGNPITMIGEGAFRECDTITSIKIPEGVTYIGTNAFRDCSSLTSIKIPEGVNNIGYSAFGGCGSLTSINIPEGVTSIGRGAFDECSSLTSINIPEGVTSIGDCSFWECSSLTSINIPESVTSIGDSAFEGCSSLTSINIPEGVTSIGWEAFEGCSSLTSINIPKGVTSIGGLTFEGCSSLTSINIPEGMTSIGIWAFEGCSSLTSINIPESVTSIGFDAFKFHSSDLVIYGAKGSYAETYAKESNIQFEITAKIHDGYDWYPSSDMPQQDIDEGISFTMSQNGVQVDSIVVGTNVDFMVSAPGATLVRLVVDGVIYEEYPLNDSGNIAFSRVISKSGLRSVQFQKYANNQWSTYSVASVLKVTDQGKLSQTSINISENITVGQEEPVAVSWNKIAYADSYAIYVYSDGNRIWPDYKNRNTLIEELNTTLPASIFDKAGEYSLHVVATGRGYDSSTSYLNFEVISTENSINNIYTQYGGVTFIEEGDLGNDAIISCTIDSENQYIAGADYGITVVTKTGVDTLIGVNNEGEYLNKRWSVYDNGDNTLTWKTYYFERQAVPIRQWQINAYSNNEIVAVKTTSAISVVSNGLNAAYYSGNVINMRAGQVINLQIVKYNNDHNAALVWIDENNIKQCIYLNEQYNLYRDLENDATNYIRYDYIGEERNVSENEINQKNTISEISLYSFDTMVSLYGSDVYMVEASTAGTSQLYINIKLSNGEEISINHIRIVISGDIGYYEALKMNYNNSQEMIKNKIIHEHVLERLASLPDNTKQTLMNYLDRSPKQFLELLLWNIDKFDIVFDPDGTIASYGPKSDSTGCEVRISPLEGYDSITAVFHELGHAIDGSCEKCVYRHASLLKQSIKDAIIDMYIRPAVDDAIEVLYGNKTGLSETVKTAIVNEIAGWRNAKMYLPESKTWTHKDPTQLMDYGNKVVSVFWKAVDILENQCIYIYNAEGGAYNSGMLLDMISATTNGTVYSQLGHGPAVKQNPIVNYWYDWMNLENVDDWLKGEYEIDANAHVLEEMSIVSEAWAEYYSSQMTGILLSQNLEVFPSATNIMDVWAKDILNYAQNNVSTD